MEKIHVKQPQSALWMEMAQWMGGSVMEMALQKGNVALIRRAFLADESEPITESERRAIEAMHRFWV